MTTVAKKGGKKKRLGCIKPSVFCLPGVNSLCQHHSNEFDYTVQAPDFFGGITVRKPELTKQKQKQAHDSKL